MRNYKRTNYFINKQFQLKYILLVVFLLLTYTGAFVATLFIPQILPLAYNAPMAEQVKAAEILLIYHKNVWPAIFIVIPVFGFFSIFITHKIAGPVYRVKMKLEEMTAWNFSGRLTLRKGDDLQDLADCVNKLAEEIQNFIADLQGNYDNISAQIEEIKQQIKTNVVPESTGKDLIMRLDVTRTSIAATLNRFRPRNAPSPE
jgi:methyl-accepting chemotaxis protein